MDKQNGNLGGKAPVIINRQTGISLGILLLLLSPLISAVIFISVTNEKIKNMEILQAQHSQQVDELKAATCDFNSRLKVVETRQESVMNHLKTLEDSSNGDKLKLLENKIGEGETKLSVELDKIRTEFDYRLKNLEKGNKDGIK